MDFNTFMNSNAGRQAVKQYETEVAARRATLIDEKQQARGNRSIRDATSPTQPDLISKDCWRTAPSIAVE